VGGPDFVDVVSVRVLGDGYQLQLRWADGTESTVDVEPYLWGPGLEPARDPAVFASSPGCSGVATVPTRDLLTPRSQRTLKARRRREVGANPMTTIEVDLSRFTTSGYGTVHGAVTSSLALGQVIAVTDDDADTLGRDGHQPPPRGRRPAGALEPGAAPPVACAASAAE
jgi:hypothetical protein